MPSAKPPRRSRGAVDRLPSGAYRVRVYAGTDPVTGRRPARVGGVPAGPRAEAEAEKVRTRLLNQLDERRNPRTRATVTQLMDRYLEILDVGETSRSAYVGYIENHIKPVLGHLPVARVDAEVLDSFYAQLRRCRTRCGGPGRPRVPHPAAAASGARPTPPRGAAGRATSGAPATSAGRWPRQRCSRFTGSSPGR